MGYRTGLTLLAALLGVAPAVAAGLRVGGLQPPAALTEAERSTVLSSGQELPAAAQVATGHEGRVELLAGGVRLMLGPDSRLQLLDDAAGIRAVLMDGALRARGGTRTAPEQLVVGVGRLDVRLRGAEALLELRSASETVCLLSGHLDIRAEIPVPWEIERPGLCLTVDPDGKHFVADAAARGLLERRLAQVELPVAGGAPRSKSGVIAGAARPPRATAGTGEDGRWTVVLGSFSDQAGALRFAGAAASRLGELSVLEVDAGDGRRLWRVCHGSYPTPERARAERDALRAEFPGAWVAPR